LLAIPWAKYCVACAELFEKGMLTGEETPRLPADIADYEDKEEEAEEEPEQPE
jgi:hypothetical protein